MSVYEEQDLIRRVQEESDRAPDDLHFPIYLDLATVMEIIGNLQLALRHPLNGGAAAQAARAFIDGMIKRMREAGYPAHAELAQVGEECGEIEGGDDEEYEPCSICSCLIGDEVGYGDMWDGRPVCENCAGLVDEEDD
jgi:hypothetical protein